MRTAAPIRWSVVIPAYNEATRLPRYLDDVVRYLEAQGESWQVIVVDDGSTDDTAALVRDAARVRPGVRLLSLGENRGKGAAVRAGMLAAQGVYRLFADADGATPIEELKRLDAAIGAGADLAIGSRVLTEPGVAVVARPSRVLAGRVFNWLRDRLGLDGIADSQCGFKLLRGHVADDLFARLTTRGFGFDVELLLLARASGYRITEVPVNWTDQPGSKVDVVKDGPRMLAQAIRARRRIGTPRR